MSSKIFFTLCLTCLSVWALTASRVSAQDFVSAKVLASEGQVEIHRETSGKLRVQNVAFKVADELRAGDTIITGKNGKLVLGLSDGSQAVIAAKTTVVIQDLSQSPRTLFQIIKGKTRIQIEKLGGQPNPYRVNTPTAVIAVRGTVFDVLVEGNETQVFLHEGQVSVSNQALPNQPVLLSAGQMTRVLLQRLPNTPNAFKVGSNDGLFKPPPAGRDNNGRIADAKTDPGRGGTTGNGGRTDSGRGNPPDNGGMRPDGGRGGPPSSGPRPNADPKGPSRKPEGE